MKGNLLDMNQEYSKREIDSHFQQIKETLRLQDLARDQRLTSQDRMLEAIHAETKKTNGRVSTVENRITDNERWRYTMIGAIGVLTAVVLPILTWALWTLVNIDGRIDSAIKEAFQTVITES